MAGGILAAVTATVRCTQQVLALTVRLGDGALGDPHPVDPPDESPPLVEYLDLRRGQVDPQAEQRDERERLKPRFTARIDQSQRTGGENSWRQLRELGGTSEAAPEFAGVVAIADQAAGHDLGLINPALYTLNAHHAAGIVDIFAGTNTVTFSQGRTNHTVIGYDARVGYDLASGVGGINGADFVPELVAAAH